MYPASLPVREDERVPDVCQPAKSRLLLLLRLLPALLIGLAFGILGWTGAPGAAPIFPDASRHLLNGAMLADMLADGGWTRPLAYATEYYQRLPALSLGYHPPGFPLVEAAWFTLTGVDYASARVLVSISGFLSCLMLYLLVLRTHSSWALATAVTFCTAVTSVFIFTVSEVMLELPSLVPALAALHALLNWTDAEPGRRFRPALAFVIFTAAAIWTKQHWVLLLPMPVVILFVRRTWMRLFERPLIVTMALGAVCVLGMALFTRWSATGNVGWTREPLHQVMLHHLHYYTIGARIEMGVLGLVLLAAGLAWYLRVRWKQGSLALPEDVYFAWFLSGFALLVCLRPYEHRYLFHLWPAAGVLALYWLPWRRPWQRSAVLACIVIAFAIFRSPLVRPADVVGHVEAARTALASSPRRVLYCGPNPGGFVYAVRRTRTDPEVFLIRGDKLPREIMNQGPKLQQFAYDFAVESIIVESGASFCGSDGAEYSFPLLKTVDLVKESGVTIGSLRVFRNSEVSSSPKSALDVASELVPGGLRLELK